MSTVTLAEAEQIIAACKEKAAAMKIRIVVSVTDGRGDLIAMVRTDKAPWRSIDISRGKAVASACMGLPSSQLEHRANDPIFLPFTISQGGHFIMGKGAVPLYRDGEIVGAVGVSGATADEDEQVATHGATALGFAIGPQ